VIPGAIRSLACFTRPTSGSDHSDPRIAIDPITVDAGARIDDHRPGSGGSQYPEHRFPLGAIVTQVTFVIRSLIAMLLVFAACAKLQAVVNDAVYFAHFNHATAAVSLLELCFAALLFWGGESREIWWQTCGLFCVFAAFNLVELMSGRQSCGCLGDVSVQAKSMLTFDLVVALTCCVVAVVSLPRHRQTIQTILAAIQHGTAVYALAVLILFGLALAPRTGLKPGPTLVSTSKPISATPVASGRKAGVVRVPLYNPTAKTITVVGGHSGCSSRVTSRLPIEIPSGKSVEIEIVAALPNYAGESRMAATLYASGGSTLEQRVVLRVAHE
jgi:hypothetical protein